MIMTRRRNLPTDLTALSAAAVALPVLAAAAALAAGPGIAHAQAVPAASAPTVNVPMASAPTVFTACYVPSSGAVYRIRGPGLPDACHGSVHVEFSWTDGPEGGQHGALSGLDADDHPQYLLADGTRALTGDLHAGANRITNLAAGSSTTDAIRYDQAIKQNEAAGGDLAGTYPAPTVAGLRGTAVSAAAPLAGQVLAYDGTAWSPANAAAGATAHGALTGLADDDHGQYLLTNGVRAATDGFAVTGEVGVGNIPVEGAGTRLMWYPGKAAFRAGTAILGEWEDSNVGVYSTAFGFRTRAVGNSSFAAGSLSAATGINSVALGRHAFASANYSVALGFEVQANHRGAVIIGAMPPPPGEVGGIFRSTAENEFTVIAFGGIRLRTGGGVGCNLPAGSGTWSCTSSRAAKTDFGAVDGEFVLARIARMPIQTWRYRTEPAGIRHVGPTAQDFHAAFGLGDSDEAIATVDADGINMLAIQALERRTAELRATARTVDRLDLRVADLEARHQELERRLERLEAALLAGSGEPRR
jgi:hypothetical protein